MTPIRQQGKVIEWKDDRGFGFIQPSDGGRRVFLHISSLPQWSRRPTVGDTVFYDSAPQPDGRVRAANAQIEGYAPPVTTRTRRNTASSRPNLWEKAVGLAVLAGIALYALLSGGNGSDSNSPSEPQTDSLPPPGYSIKGNIAVATGNKVYHVPGCEDYEETIIDPFRGERWFRTEAEAIAAGWRKAAR